MGRRRRLPRRSQHSKNRKRPRWWHRTGRQDYLYERALRRLRGNGVSW